MDVGRGLRNLLLLLAATLTLSWPHVVNGYPTVFLDTVPFFVAGRKALTVAGVLPPAASKPAATSAIAAAAPPATGAAAPPATTAAAATKPRGSILRSPFYGAAALVIAQGAGGWGGVALAQALWLAAALLIALPRLGVASARARLATIAVVGVVTSLPFYAHVLVADVFGGLVPLATALLIVKDTELSRAERGFWWLTLLGACLFHPSFALHGAALLVVVLPWLWRQGAAVRRSALPLAALLGTALLAHAAVPLLADRVSAGAVTPPFLLARAIGDGTAGKVLRADCPDQTLVSCSFVAGLPMTENQFLWESAAVKPWSHHDNPERLAINAEQGRILLAVVQRHPGEQAIASLGNSLRQFVTVDLDDFGRNPQLRASMLASGFGAEYDRFRQTPMGAGDTRYQGLASLWGAIYLVSAALLAVTLVAATVTPDGFGARVPPALLTIVVILFVGLLLNAVVNGALAGVFGRYQGRVSWLAPFACAVLVQALASRTRAAVPQHSAG